jgi:hypothetical protein
MPIGTVKNGGVGAPVSRQITPENISGLLFRLDQALQITRCLRATIPECAEEGFDQRAAVMGVATLIDGIYMDIAEGPPL